MAKHFKLYSIYVLFFLCISIPNSYAKEAYSIQRTDRFTEPWRWKLFEELSGKNIMCFTSDEQGMLYFLSRTNLYTYDGYNWADYPLPNKTNLTGLTIKIKSLPSGIFIAGGDVLLLFNDGKFTDLSLPKLKKVRNICNDIIEIENDFYIFGLTCGMYVVRGNEGFFYVAEALKNLQDTTYENFHIIPFPYNLENEIKVYAYGLLKKENNLFKAFLTAGPHSVSMSFTPTKKDKLPLQIHNIQHNPKAEQFGHAPNLVQSKKNNEYWVSTGDIFKPVYRNNPNQVIEYDFNEIYGDRNTHSSLLELKDGRIVVGGEGQIYTFSDNDWTRYIKPDIPLTSTGYIQMATTNDGNVWMGGQNGEIYHFTYSYTTFLTAKDIYFQFQHSDKSSWFLTRDNKAVRRSKREWIAFSQADGLVDEPIKIVETADGFVCCAGRYKGEVALSFYHKNNWLVFPLPEITIDIDKRAFYADKLGNIWLGTIPGQEGQIVKISNTAIKDFLEKGKRLYSNEVNSDSITGVTSFSFELDVFRNKHSVGITHGIDSAVFISSQHNVIKIDGDKVERLTNKIRGKKSIIASGNSGETLWVGTEDKGLYKLTQDTLINFNIDNGLVSNIIVDILVDTDSTVWVATEKDVSRYIHGNWINNCFPKEFNIVKEGGNLNVSHNGSIWFNIVPRNWVLKRSARVKNMNSTRNDFIAVRVAPDTLPPITHIDFYSEKVSADGNTHIKWSGNDKWNQTLSKDLLFSYKLNQDEWTPFKNQHDHTFLSLHRGRYTLQVRAMDKFGNIDSTPEAVQFYVMPPVYLRWWFIVMVSFFIVIILFLVSRIVLRNKKLAENNYELKEQKEEILAQNEEIQQQAEELHAQKDALAEQKEALAEQNEEIVTKNEQISEAFKRFELISEFGQKITATLDLDTINEMIFSYAKSIIDISAFGIGLYDDKEELIYYPKFYNGDNVEENLIKKLSNTKSLTSICFNKQEVIFINDIESEAVQFGLETNDISNLQIGQSRIHIPLTVECKRMGVLVINSDKKNAYTKEDLTNMQTLASYISISLDNAKAYDTINHINKNTEKSINYASTIQNAFLPQPKNINEYINAFVLFKPKDIVSGDYYWFLPIEKDTTKPVDVLIAAMDCTGHGVPGALMSLVGNSLMRETIKNNKVFNPAEILTQLNLGIKTALKQESTGNNDGMDAAMARIQQTGDSTFNILFGGAKNPLVIVRSNGELDVVKGSRFSIGGAKLRKEKVFEQQEFTLHSGDQIYLFSDGYADQNGPDREKFGRDNMLKLIQKNANLGLPDQQQYLEEALTSHMKNADQRDDITLIGIKL